MARIASGLAAVDHELQAALHEGSCSRSIIARSQQPLLASDVDHSTIFL